MTFDPDAAHTRLSSSVSMARQTQVSKHSLFLLQQRTFHVGRLIAWQDTYAIADLYNATADATRNSSTGRRTLEHIGDWDAQRRSDVASRRIQLVCMMLVSPSRRPVVLLT